MRLCRVTVADSCEVENAKNISKLRQFVTHEPQSFSLVVGGQTACVLKRKVRPREFRELQLSGSSNILAATNPPRKRQELRMSLDVEQ